MPLLSQEQRHHALVQLRSSVSTRKVAALVGMSQSFVAHLRKVVWGDLRDREEGVQSFLQIERRGVMPLLLLKVDLTLYLQQQIKLDLKHVNCCLTLLEACLERAWIGYTSAAKEAIF